VQFSTNGLTLLSLLHKSHKACPFSIRTQFDSEFSGLPVMAAGEKASVAIKLLHIALLFTRIFQPGFVLVGKDDRYKTGFKDVESCRLTVR